MRKEVVLYTVPGEDQCDQIHEFLSEQDIRLRVRDIKSDPLNFNEIVKLIRHLDLKHFLKSPDKLNGNHHERSEVFEMLAKDNDLIVKPIIVAGRLMVVGPNRAKIREMLQLRTNGSGDDNGSGNINANIKDGYSAGSRRA